jgi:hypothetical protein
MPGSAKSTGRKPPSIAKNPTKHPLFNGLLDSVVPIAARKNIVFFLQGERKSLTGFNLENEE